MGLQIRAAYEEDSTAPTGQIGESLTFTYLIPEAGLPTDARAMSNYSRFLCSDWFRSQAPEPC